MVSFLGKLDQCELGHADFEVLQLSCNLHNWAKIAGVKLPEIIMRIPTPIVVILAGIMLEVIAWM